MGHELCPRGPLTQARSPSSVLPHGQSCYQVGWIPGDTKGPTATQREGLCPHILLAPRRIRFLYLLAGWATCGDTHHYTNKDGVSVTYRPPATDPLDRCLALGLTENHPQLPPSPSKPPVHPTQLSTINPTQNSTNSRGTVPGSLTRGVVCRNPSQLPLPAPAATEKAVTPTAAPVCTTPLQALTPSCTLGRWRSWSCYPRGPRLLPLGVSRCPHVACLSMGSADAAGFAEASRHQGLPWASTGSRLSPGACPLSLMVCLTPGQTPGIPMHTRLPGQLQPSTTALFQPALLSVILQLR